MHKQRYNLKKPLAKSIARAQCFDMQNELNKAAKQAEELAAGLRVAGGPLVPAIEVERAWHEAFVVGATRPVSPDDEWRRSRARRVVEGGES